MFAGYAEWGPGQPEAGMEGESWVLAPAREDDVFTEVPEVLWIRVVPRQGGEYERLPRTPFDPSMR